MRKYISIFSALIIFACILCGCSSPARPATIADDVFLSESVSAIPETSFSFSKSEYADIKFESYLHEHGTSSVNSSILIYRYDDTLIFAVSYFQGPASAMETFVLSQEQGDAFLAMVSNCKKANQTDSGSHPLGGSYTEYILNDGAKQTVVEPLALSALGLTLKTEDDLTFVDGYPYKVPTGESAAIFPAMLTVGHSYPAFYSCIGEQADRLFGSSIASVEEIEVGPTDGLMHVTLTDGSTHKLLVTTGGFIAYYI